MSLWSDLVINGVRTVGSCGRLLSGKRTSFCPQCVDRVNQEWTLTSVIYFSASVTGIVWAANSDCFLNVEFLYLCS